MDVDDLQENCDEQEEQDDLDDNEEQDEQDEIDEQDEGDDEEEVEVQKNNKVENQTSSTNTENVKSEVKNQRKNPSSSSARLRKSHNNSRNTSKTEVVQTHPAQNEDNLTKQNQSRSANAFINFVKDFRKDNTEELMGRNVLQICGERWKSMSDDEKQPYIEAANLVKRLKQRNTGESTVQSNKKSLGRVSKRKVDTKRKETFQKRTKTLDVNSDSDTDTATTTVLSLMSDPDSS